MDYYYYYLESLWEDDVFVPVHITHTRTWS